MKIAIAASVLAAFVAAAAQAQGAAARRGVADRAPLRVPGRRPEPVVRVPAEVVVVVAGVEDEPLRVRRRVADAQVPGECSLSTSRRCAEASRERHNSRRC